MLRKGTPVRVLHTSKRMHFIEDYDNVFPYVNAIALAYVKTYALH